MSCPLLFCRFDWTELRAARHSMLCRGMPKSIRWYSISFLCNHVCIGGGGGGGGANILGYINCGEYKSGGGLGYIVRLRDNKT